MSNGFLSELQWSALLRGIEQDKCVICLGPEIFTPKGAEENQSDRLGNFLTARAEELGVRVRENGWYHLRSTGDDWVAYEAVNQFYVEEVTRAEDILRQLARINGHLFLSLTPDRALAQAFADQHFHHHFEAYVRNEPDRNTRVPTKEEPLLYNLLGELGQRNSLVLTYDDFFDYLQSIFRGNSMSSLLKDNILSADCFLFLGMPADDWRMHLFMRILKQHESRKSKYATMPGASEIVKESWQEQYGIRLVNEDIQGFLNELERRCGTMNLLRQAQVQSPGAVSLPDQLRENVAQGELSATLNGLQTEIKKAKAAGRELMLQVIQLRNRLRGLEDKLILNLLNHEQEGVERGQISYSILQLINRLEDEAPQLGLRL